MKTRARPRAAGLLLCALLAVASAWGAQAIGVLRGLEQRSVGERFEWRGPQRPDDIVVVAVDDVTFAALGHQWPFPRSMHGRVIDRLRAAGARQIVYDVQFTEPSKPREDWALYRAVARARNVALATTEFEADGSTNVLGGDRRLAQAHARAGASNLPDGDGGVLERFPRGYGRLPSLAVVAAGMAGRPAPPQSEFPPGGARIDFRGPPGTIRTVSFSDVLRGDVPASVLRGRIVVVGASAPSLRDVHVTPTGAAPMAGPEIQANAIWTAMNGLPLRDAPGASLLLVVLLGIAAPLCRLRLKVLPSVLLGLPLAGAHLAAAQMLFERGFVVWLTTPLVALAVGTVAMVVDSHLSESATRRRVAQANSELEARVYARTRELRATQLEILQRLAGAAEWRDGDTGDHLTRIGRLCHDLALALGVPPERAEMLMHASTAHDIGKVGIPDRILHKAGELDDDERATMESHALIGASILAGSDAALLQLAEEIARTHHERWDGSGYPDGLREREIPLAGRICAICDVFDALVSTRPYKRAWTLDEALEEIRSQAGRHFDPDLVEPFIGVARATYAELYDDRAADAPVTA